MTQSPSSRVVRNPVHSNVSRTCTARTVIELSYFIVKHSPVTWQGSESCCRSTSPHANLFTSSRNVAGETNKKDSEHPHPSPRTGLPIFLLFAAKSKRCSNNHPPPLSPFYLLLLAPLIFICRWIMLTHSHLPVFSVVFSGSGRYFGCYQKKKITIDSHPTAEGERIAVDEKKWLM